MLFASGGRVQRAVDICLPRGVTADLAAGGSRQTAVLQHDHLVQRQSELRQYCAACGTHNLLTRQLVHRPPAHFVRNDNALFAAAIDGKRGSEPAAERGMARLNDGLDVVRVIVAAADDDEIFQPAGDEQLTVMQKAQGSGAKTGPVSRLGQSSLEHFARCAFAVPVALCDAGTLDPYLTDSIGGGWPLRLLVDDDHLLLHGAAETVHLA